MIPDYQSIMLPLLEMARDGGTLNLRDIVTSLAAHFKLNDEEKNALLPSKNQRTFDNRVGWALTYLKKAGLLESPARAVFRITEAGKKLLADKPVQINNKLLSSYPSFVEFRSRPETSDNGTEIEQPPPSADSETPEARIASAILEINTKLLDDLYDQLQLISWQFFERLVLSLLKSMGYGGTRLDAAIHLGGSGDQGVDGVINEDALGLDKIYVQAKKWVHPVGSPEIQAFVGALAAKNARKGVFLTTNAFTQGARSFIGGVGNYSVALIDGRDLAKLMLKHDVGIQAASQLTIKRIDNDFFSEDEL